MKEKLKANVEVRCIEAGKPTANGRVYSVEVLQSVVDRLNEKRLTVSNGDVDLERGGVKLKDVVGVTVPGTAQLINGRVNFHAVLPKAVLDLIDRDDVTVTPRMIAHLKGQKVTAVDEVEGVAVVPKKGVPDGG